MGKSEANSLNNGSGSTTCDNKNIISPKPNNGRYCHIFKRPDFDGYGFNLHSEKVKPGQYIGKVDPNSPAEAAGLREGDQIIEVNGVNIGTETHKQVVQRIKAISNEVRLLLIDPNNEGVKSDSLEKTTDISKGRNMDTAGIQSTPQPNSPSIVSVTADTTAEAANVSPYQKEYITSISMITTQSQSSPSNNNNTTVDTADGMVDVSTTNGHHSIANGKSIEDMPKIPISSSAASEPQATQQIQQNIDSSQNNANNKTGLNLNLTAAEMRAKLLAKKKFDPKNETVDLKKKFDIIQKL